MKLTRLLVIFLLLLEASACSHFYAQRDNLNEQIDEWLAENEFTQIDNTLKYVSSSHPDYWKIKSRKKEISNKKVNFINNTVARADRLIGEQKWQEALDVYSEAQNKLEDDPTLRKHKAKLVYERDTQVKELRKDMMLRRARALVQYSTIYAKLEKLIPDDYSARYDIKKYEDEKEEIVAELGECGEYALDIKDYTLAEECIDLSNQLIASERKQTMLVSIRRKKKLVDDRRKSIELIEAYQKAYDIGDFPKARYYLETLIDLDSGHEKARQLKAQLDRDINQRVERGIADGKTLYSQGKINEALDIWQDLLKIDPKNEELVSLIARGKKISKKIRNLEKSTNN